MVQNTDMNIMFIFVMVVNEYQGCMCRDVKLQTLCLEACCAPSRSALFYCWLFLRGVKEVVCASSYLSSSNVSITLTNETLVTKLW